MIWSAYVIAFLVGTDPYGYQYAVGAQEVYVYSAGDAATEVDCIQMADEGRKRYANLNGLKDYKVLKFRCVPGDVGRQPL